jgi:hypothetical protein
MRFLISDHTTRFTGGVLLIAVAGLKTSLP